jgi:hypothetical protein
VWAFLLQCYRGVCALVGLSTNLSVDYSHFSRRQGGRILIKVATALGNKLSISAKNCDFSIHNSNFVFNINGTQQQHHLILSLCCFHSLLHR